MEYLNIDGKHFYSMVVNASNRLEEQKEFVNSLNVFPVPDGDTGTNMSMTFKTAVCELENMDTDSIEEISKRLSKGALMGARGNSGVILSQIFRGIAKGFEGTDKVDAETFANALMEGANYAYKAVMRPTEGTILTIIKAAGESAVNNPTNDLAQLLDEVCKHSEVVLNKTPDMLPALKEAKVVDAGGMGLLILLKGMFEALKYDIKSEVNKSIEEVKPVETAYISSVDIKYGYCTEFFILAKDIDIESFKSDLEKHGDSMVVVGLDDIVKVHIHTNDPGLILSKAVKLGELSKIKIENMKEQHRSLLGIDNIAVEKDESNAKKYAFIAVARGEGIKKIFEDLGVDRIIEGGQTMNPSTQDILDCIEKVNAENIFVLPNNGNIRMAAEQAVDLTEKKVVVLPTKTIPQGITALTMFNGEAEVEENNEMMQDAISNVLTGSVTYAVKDTEADGRQIKQNDILGLVEGKINEIGSDKYEVCQQIIDSMVNEYSELITIYYGQDCDADKVEEFVEKLEEKYPDLDIQYYNGEQPLYYFIASVE